MEISDFSYMLVLLVALGASALLVITRNLFYAALALMLIFLALAALYVLLGAEFVAVSQIVIYVGGVLILIVFGILLTNRSVDGKALFEQYRTLPAFLLSAFMFYLLWQMINQMPNMPAPTSNSNVIPKIGINLMTTNIIPFELVAVLLLIALIGAAFIIKPEKP